jgi:hypothetical protein
MNERTPRLLAAMGGDQELINLLVQARKPDVDSRDDGDRTKLVEFMRLAGSMTPTFLLSPRTPCRAKFVDTPFLKLRVKGLSRS